MPTYRISSKQICIPQEKVSYSSGDKWYLDSDCGRKMTGGELAICNAPVYSASVAITDSAAELINVSGITRVFIQNTGTLTVELSVDDGANYFLQLLPGESFSANCLDDVWAKTTGVGALSTCRTLTAQRVL